MKPIKKSLTLILTVLILISSLFIYKVIFTEDESLSVNIDKSNINNNLKTRLEKVKSNNRTNYYMDLSFDEENKKLTAYESIIIINNYNDDLNNIIFHLYPDSYNSGTTLPSIGNSSAKMGENEIGDIEICSIIINGNETSFTQDNQILNISLDTPLKPKQHIEISINFKLKIPRGTNRLGYINSQYSITNWYPILSIYNDKTDSWDTNPFYPIGESNYSDCSDYEIHLNIPDDVIVASTGIKTHESIENNIKTVILKADNVRDFDFFMSEDYKVISREINGITVNSYYFSKYYESTAKRMLTLACDAIEFFGETFGEYPYEEFDIVESYLSGGAMEYPTIIQMGNYYPMPEKIDGNNLSFYDEAVVHEVAHQWWYSTVGNNEYEESILDESFTAFSTALFFEKRFGEYNSRAVKSAFLYRDYPKEFPLYRSVDEMSYDNWGVIVYKLGAIVLEDLRRTIGEEKFIEVFRDYYSQYKFKNATFEGFLSVLEENCGKEIKEYVQSAYTSDNYDTSKLKLTEEDRSNIQKNRH